MTEFNQIDGKVGFGIDLVGLGIRDQTSNHRIMRVRAGWPLKCVEGDEWHFSALGPDLRIPDAQMILSNAATYEQLEVVYPNQLPLITLSRAKFVPYRVRWGPLAVDAVVYGVAVWLMVSGILAWRGRRRAIAGRCRACGYQLKDLTRCPECGKPVNSRRTNEGVPG